MGYVETIKNDKVDEYIPSLIACFGFVCSVAWSLVNRGSKYWQKNWENIIRELEEREEIGCLFNRTQPISNVKKEENESKVNFKWWLKKRQFSVSKLAIAISDILIIVWLFLIFQDTEIIKFFDKININISVTISVLTLFFVVLIFFCTKKSKENKVFENNELCKDCKKRDN